MKITVAVMAEHKPDTFSKIIMRTLGVKYSHVAIIYKDYVYHAIQRGVCKERLEDVLKIDYPVESYDVELKCSEDYFLGFMSGAVGRDYNETQLLGFVGKWFHKMVSDGRREFTCSEFGAWVLEEMAGYKWDENIDFVDPEEFISHVRITQKP